MLLLILISDVTADYDSSPHPGQLLKFFQQDSRTIFPVKIPSPCEAIFCQNFFDHLLTYVFSKTMYKNAVLHHKQSHANNIHICIAPYDRNFRGARPGSVLVGVRKGKRVSLGEEKCL